MSYSRIVPLIVAVALFMENMDSTVIATSLPAIAADLGTNPLTLKLAVTCYLLSLAVFIPVSGWCADRFGTRTVFRAAIVVFMLGSLGCATATSLTHFVIARIVEGMGGAMMTPVGRLILVRTIERTQLVRAMVWVTVPALIGPLMGPPLGGFITTYFSWHWIFIINIPIGLIGIALATRYVENLRADRPDPFDLRGFLLAGTGIAGLAFGFSVLGLRFVPTWIIAGLLTIGTLSVTAYVIHARRATAAILDLSLLRLPTFRSSIIGGSIFRIGIGAMPFLLPLLLQLGFKLTAFQSGMITLSTALGAMTMKTATPVILRRWGFRRVLIANALISAVFVAACAGFTATTPIPVMIAVLVMGGFFRSLEFTSLNLIAYAELDASTMSRATPLVSVAQQLSISTGVAVGALAVEATTRLTPGGVIRATDFAPAFILIGLIAASAALVFRQLAPDAGADIANHRPAGRADRNDANG